MSIASQFFFAAPVIETKVLPLHLHFYHTRKIRYLYNTRFDPFWLSSTSNSGSRKLSITCWYMIHVPFKSWCQSFDIVCNDGIICILYTYTGTIVITMQPKQMCTAFRHAGDCVSRSNIMYGFVRTKCTTKFYRIKILYFCKRRVISKIAVDTTR